MIDCVSATGQYFTPGIVFKGENLQYQWFQKEMAQICPYWHFTVSPNGWTSDEICLFWLRQVFLPQVNTLRGHNESKAVLMIFDGHRSHTAVSLLIYLLSFVY